MRGERRSSSRMADGREDEQLEVGVGADVGGVRLAGDDRALAERGAGGEHGDAALGAVRVGDVGAGLAGDDEEDARRLLALGDDPLPGGHAAALEQRAQRAQLLRAQVAGEAVLGERDRVGGGDLAAVALDQAVLGPGGGLVGVVEHREALGAGQLAVGVDERERALGLGERGLGGGQHPRGRRRRSPTRARCRRTITSRSSARSVNSRTTASAPANRRSPCSA